MNPQLGSGLGLGLGSGLGLLGLGLGSGLGLDSVRGSTISHKMKYLPQIVLFALTKKKKDFSQTSLVLELYIFY